MKLGSPSLDRSNAQTLEMVANMMQENGGRFPTSFLNPSVVVDDMLSTVSCPTNCVAVPGEFSAQIGGLSCKGDFQKSLP